ncbi:MAG TPA: hypothetical protein VFC23_16855, partial [Thermoanaerobaculia bacterium]|nr:hypothetical protein [Thermoanaerobaculia bacterium]
VFRALGSAFKGFDEVFGKSNRGLNFHDKRIPREGGTSQSRLSSTTGRRDISGADMSRGSWDASVGSMDVSRGS